MSSAALSVVIFVLFGRLLAAANLQIYFVDVEGGAATLIGAQAGRLCWPTPAAPCPATATPIEFSRSRNWPV